MKLLLLLILIIPFIPFLLILPILLMQKSDSGFFKKWFFELFIYLMQLIRGCAIAYSITLIVLIAILSIVKTIEFDLITSLDVHLKILIAAWTISFFVTDYKYFEHKKA